MLKEAANIAIIKTVINIGIEKKSIDWNPILNSDIIVTGNKFKKF